MTRSLLIDRIGELVTNDPERGESDVLADVSVCCEGERIVFVGPSRLAPASDLRIDAEGRCVIPGFVDSHTHLVFAGDRAAEFEARSSGHAYSAGGIRSTVAATRAASNEMLLDNASRLAGEALRSGTTTLETKSG
jgi:imidazolonepropionase